MSARLAPDADPSPDPLVAESVETGSATARRFLLLLALCGLVLVAGAASVIWSLHRESVAQHEASVLEDAERHTRAITQMRNFYSAEIVPRARDGGLACALDDAMLDFATQHRPPPQHAPSDHVHANSAAGTRR